MSFIGHGKYSHLKLATRCARPKSKSKLTHADRERMLRELCAVAKRLSPYEIANAAARCHPQSDYALENSRHQAVAKTQHALIEARCGLPLGLGTIALANLIQRLKRENFL